MNTNVRDGLIEATGMVITTAIAGTTAIATTIVTIATGVVTVTNVVADIGCVDEPRSTTNAVAVGATNAYDKAVKGPGENRAL